MQNDFKIWKVKVEAEMENRKNPLGVVKCILETYKDPSSQLVCVTQINVGN